MENQSIETHTNNVAQDMQQQPFHCRRCPSQRRLSCQAMQSAASHILLLIWMASCFCCSNTSSSTSSIIGMNVAAFAPPNSLQIPQSRTVHNIPTQHTNPLLSPSATTSRQTTPIIITKSSTSRPLSSGIEDIIFSAQSTAASLANTVISSGQGGANSSNNGGIASLLILYTAGLWTSFSPCSLGLLPITLSYITTAAKERKDENTILPTLAFASGLALVFTALGVSASVLGGVFGSTGNSLGGGEDQLLSSLLLAAVSSLLSVLMGLQLLELIRIPLPSLDFKWRSSVMAGNSGGGSRVGGGGDSLFDENGGLILNNLQSSEQKDASAENDINGIESSSSSSSSNGNIEETDSDGERAALLRTFLLGGTSALVASPCATPVLASLLAYLASVSSSTSAISDTWKGASWMLSYTFGYSTPLLLMGATGGQALVNLQSKGSSWIGQWVTPLTGGVLIVFGMNGFLVALLGDPSLAGLAPIIE